MQKLSVYKKFLSYLYPLPVRSAKGFNNSDIELFLYRGQWQLANNDALYSDGNRYRPLLLAFRDLKNVLPTLNKVLVLGAGLGSAVQILNKMGFQPAIKLVDIDKLILQWALELCEPAIVGRITPVCADANYFLRTDKETYDLLVVDIFEGRIVPSFVTSVEFLEQCHSHVVPGGYLILNYIVNDNSKWHKVRSNVDKIFPGNRIVQFDINRIFIAQIR